MTRILTINTKKIRFWVVFFVAVCFAFFMVRLVFAEEGSPSAEVKKYNITFPVSTLGNCTDLKSCKAYCEDPINKEACVNFAKSKGFYKEPSKTEGTVRTRLLIEKAKTELGCNTEEECKAFCQDSTNADKCRSFAKKYGLGKQVEEAARNSTLEKAKSFLGCTSEETCKAFCKETVNQEKCSQFAKMAGLSGGMVKVASMSGKNQDGLEQVKKLIERCKENPDYCQQNIEAVEKEITQKSQEFCKSNPQRCKELQAQFKQATGAARICNEGPGKCRSASSSGNLNRPNTSQVQGVTTSLSLLQQIFHFFFK